MKSEKIQIQNELFATKTLLEDLQKPQKKEKAIDVKKLPEYVTIQNQVNDLTKQLKEKTKELATSKNSLDRANEKLQNVENKLIDAKKTISELNRPHKTSPTSAVPVVSHNSTSSVVVSKGSKKNTPKQPVPSDDEDDVENSTSTVVVFKGSKKNTPKQSVASENEDDVEEDLKRHSPSNAADSDDDVDNSYLRALVNQKKQLQQKQKQDKLLEKRILLKQLAELSARPSNVDDTEDLLRSVSQRDYLSSSLQVIHCFYQRQFFVVFLCHIYQFCSNNSRSICCIRLTNRERRHKLLRLLAHRI